MPDAPTTHPSLLLRLRDPDDRDAWGEFVDLYAPFVYGYARKRGLQDADAADLTQTVLRAVAGAVGRFDYSPARGSFRGWLFTIVRNKLRSFRAARDGFCRGSGDSATLALLEAQPAPDAEAEQWQREWEERLFARAAEKVRARVQDATWQAFWRTAVDGKPGKEVAAELGISVAAVYLARGRVLARLRAEVTLLADE